MQIEIKITGESSEKTMQEILLLLAVSGEPNNGMGEPNNGMGEPNNGMGEPITQAPDLAATTQAVVGTTTEPVVPYKKPRKPRVEKSLLGSGDFEVTKEDNGDFSVDHIPETTIPQEVGEETLDLQTVRGVAVEKSRGGKHTEVKALLATYGVSKVTELAVENYPDFYTKVKAL
jgi:hypothetical protein